MFGIATNTKETLKGWEKTKDSKKPQKTKNPKKPKSWEKCCAQGFPPGDCFFCFFWFSSRFFWFLDSEIFIGYRAEKKQNHSKKAKKTKETKKTKVWGEMCPRVSSRGLFFLVSLVFLFFFLVFLVFRLGSFHGLQGWEKTKKLEENQKNQRNQKNQSLGRNVPKGFLQGIVFFVFFGFLRVFFGF